MQVIHIGTQIQTVFGLLDDKGDVVEQIPVRLQINQLTDEPFLQAVKHLMVNSDTPTTSRGGGVGVIALGNATTAPSTNPTNGVVIYVDPADGKLKVRDATGNVHALW